MQSGSTATSPRTVHFNLRRRATSASPSARESQHHVRKRLRAKQEATPAPSYDPVALAESLRTAAEKSAKAIGDFAARQAATRPSLVTDELGIGKAFMEIAAKMLANPYRLAETQMNLWWDYMSLWQILDDEASGRGSRPDRGPLQGRQAISARGLAGAFPVRLHQAVLPDHRALAARCRRQRRRARRRDEEEGRFLHAPVHRCAGAVEFRADQSRKCFARRSRPAARTWSRA